jgi:hypothetical protein
MHGVRELLLLMSVMSGGVLLVAQTSQGLPQVTVCVYNDSDAPEQTVLKAEGIATRIFRETGVDMDWIDAARHSGKTACAGGPAAGTSLILRIIPKPLTLTDTVFGVAFLSEDGSGRYADVFYAPLQKLSGVRQVDASILLAHVVAHEIGHLLLGSNAHAHLGVMRSHWESGDLLRAAMGGLLFTSDESRRMRGRLLSRTRFDSAKDRSRGDAFGP